MRRRKLLLGSAFSATAFAEPALFTLTVSPAQSTARAGGQRVGMADVEVFTEQITHLGKLGHQYGSGRVRGQVVALLHREANQLVHGSYSETTGRALLSAVANATKTAAFIRAMSAGMRWRSATTFRGWTWPCGRVTGAVLPTSCKRRVA